MTRRFLARAASPAAPPLTGAPITRAMTTIASIAVALVAVVLGASGCRDEPPLPTVAPTSRAPVDTTAPGELAEGPERAFGLAIPRDMRIKAKLDDTWYADGALALEDVASYVDARVEPRRVDRGPNKTVFVDAAVRGDAKRRVEVEIARSGGRVEMVVRDRTPLPVEEGLTVEERWRQAGMTPDGKVLPEQAE